MSGSTSAFLPRPRIVRGRRSTLRRAKKIGRSLKHESTRIMSSGVRNVADALVDLAAANVENRGDVDDELLKTTERLINHNPSLVEWVPDLVMERRGSRSGAHYWHPRLPDRWYDRFNTSGGHPGLLNAILEAAGLSAAAAGPSAAAAGPSRALAARPPRDSPPENHSPENPRSTLLTEGQVDDSVRAVSRLVRQYRALQERVANLVADLAERDEWIRETHNLYRAQSEKLNKRKRG